MSFFAGTETPCIISGVSGLVFTEIAQNVAKIVPFNTCKSELRYANLLWNNSVLNKVHFVNFFCPKLFDMATSLKGSKKRSGSRKFMQIPFIWWTVRENWSSRSWHNLAQVEKKKLTQAKYIARSANVPNGLNNMSHMYSSLWNRNESPGRNGTGRLYKVTDLSLQFQSSRNPFNYALVLYAAEMYLRCWTQVAKMRSDWYMSQLMLTDLCNDWWSLIMLYTKLDDEYDQQVKVDCRQ